MADDKDCYTIAEFCARNGISRATYFNLRGRGEGPREIQIGVRKLISKEAAADWRREREAASARKREAA